MTQLAHACLSGLQPLTSTGTDTPAVRYSASGHLLVIDPAPEQLAQLRRHDWPGAITVCSGLTEPDPSAADSALKLVPGQVLELQGWLGRFQARAVDPNGQALGQMSGKGSGHFDLVIDCGREALLGQNVLPFGYFRVGSDGRLDSALEDAAALIGNFSKPKYFHYEAEICAHYSYGQPGCTRCLDVCGAAAIQSGGQKIEVNPYLCQGCGSCTLACPTGALSFVEPSPTVLLEELRRLASAGETSASTLIVSDGPVDQEDSIGASQLQVQPLTAFGEELWVAALALGYSQVVLRASGPLDAQSQSLLEHKLADLQRLLPALGLQSAAVILTEPESKPADRPGAASKPGHSDTEFEALLKSATARQTKRHVLNAGLAALAREPESNPGVLLSPGAALGEIVVDEQRCTLCSSCAKLCPTGAIDYSEREQAGTARLSFLEASCVQCGICVNGCPEQAIALAPRLAPSALRLQRRVVSSSPMAECRDCGAQFAAEKLLRRTLERLAEHGATEAALEQSVRCPRCRAVRVG